MGGSGKASQDSRPSRWLLVIAVAVGALTGLGAYTFAYAEGLSYLSTDPRACVNCHIMQPEYDGWQMASHHTVAVCVDCHLPHDFVPKYFVKAENGWRHGKLFTTGGFTEPIELKPAARAILQENCERCHAAIEPIGSVHESAYTQVGGQDPLRCTHCHATVGHGAKTGIGGPLPRPLPEADIGASESATGK